MTRLRSRPDSRVRSLGLLLILLSALAGAGSPELAQVLEDAARLQPLETVLIRRGGERIAVRGYRGHGIGQPANIKSGSSHLLSVILTRETGRSTLALARDWLGPVDGFRINHCQRVY